MPPPHSTWVISLSVTHHITACRWSLAVEMNALILTLLLSTVFGDVCRQVGVVSSTSYIEIREPVLLCTAVIEIHASSCLLKPATAMWTRINVNPALFTVAGPDTWNCLVEHLRLNCSPELIALSLTYSFCVFTFIHLFLCGLFCFYSSIA